MKIPVCYGIFLLVICVTSSCRNDRVQASNSLRGKWQVTDIISQYGSFSNGNFIETSTLKEAGNLGEFTFGKGEVSYKFTRNDTLYSATAPWTLAYEKVNAGFTRVPKFTLDMGQKFSFDVFFEDGTKNAEKNAKRLTLTELPMVGTPMSEKKVFITLQLQKIE